MRTMAKSLALHVVQHLMQGWPAPPSGIPRVGGCRDWRPKTRFERLVPVRLYTDGELVIDYNMHMYCTQRLNRVHTCIHVTRKALHRTLHKQKNATTPVITHLQHCTHTWTMTKVTRQYGACTVHSIMKSHVKQLSIALGRPKSVGVEHEWNERGPQRLPSRLKQASEPQTEADQHHDRTPRGNWTAKGRQDSSAAVSGLGQDDPELPQTLDGE
jgi:hypothetical protein